jgi:hypothetical protein
VSWKRLSAAVGLEPETMMMWERGVTRDPPVGKVLLYAREVGITLEELAATVLASDAPAGQGVQGGASAAGAIEALSALDARREDTRLPKRASKRRRPKAG